MFNKVSLMATLGAFAVLGAQPAWAIDADQFGARLKEAVHLLGIAVDYGSASVAADTVTLSDVTILVPGEDGAEVPGDVVFSGVAETGDGGFTVETASIPDIAISDLENGFMFSVRNVAVERITLPGPIEADDLLPAAMGLYQSLTAGPLVVGLGGAEIFSIDSLLTTVEGPTADGDYTSRTAIEGISADLSAIADDDPKHRADTFGIERFSGSISGDSTWNPDTGRAGISDFIFTMDGLGSLALEGTALGYDRALFQEIMKTYLGMGETAQRGAEISESEMARIEQVMADEIASVEIEGFVIRYDDNSLFMKVLDTIAAEQGVDSQTLTSGFKVMAPMMMGDLPNAVAKAVTAQASAFLDDPRNFTISAAPEAPVSVEALAIAEEDPFALVELLNITVTANQ